MIAIGLVLAIVFFAMHKVARKLAIQFLFTCETDMYNFWESAQFNLLLLSFASGLVALVGFGIFLWRVMP